MSISYHTDTGFYAADGAYFQTTGVTNGPLQALASGVDGLNGVYRYGASAFPTDSFNATNYWVDVKFATSVATDTWRRRSAPSRRQTAPPTWPLSHRITATFSET